jgi:hypothetical protein
VSAWAYVGVYFVGIVVGVLANTVLDVQLRRPSLTKTIALLLLAVLVGIFIATHNVPMPSWLLMVVWYGIGLLAGLGSREARAPLA